MKNKLCILLILLIFDTLHSYDKDLINVKTFEMITKEDSITVKNLMFKTENFIRENEKLLLDYIKLCKNDTLFDYNIYRLVDTECFKNIISDNDSAKFILKKAIDKDFNMRSYDSLLRKYNVKDNYDLFKTNFCNLAKKISNLFNKDHNFMVYEIRISNKIIFIKKREPIDKGFYAEMYLHRFIGFNHVLSKYNYFDKIPENYHKDKFELTIVKGYNGLGLYYPLVLDSTYYGEIIIEYYRED